MKFSSSFKVGLLTLIALILLVGTVLKVKGRALTNAKRIEIQFKDVTLVFLSIFNVLKSHIAALNPTKLAHCL